MPYGKLTDGCAHQVYPQQFLVADLIRSYLDGGGTIHFETPATAITGLDQTAPQRHHHQRQIARPPVLLVRHTRRSNSGAEDDTPATLASSVNG